MYVGDPPRNWNADIVAYANAQGVHNEKAIAVMLRMADEMGHSNGHTEILICFDGLLEIGKAYEN